MRAAVQNKSCQPDSMHVTQLARSDYSDRNNVVAFPNGNARRGKNFQIWFPEAFARYLREVFDRPEEVAAYYRVRMSTAWKWWNGESGASGHQVMRTLMCDPEALPYFIADFRGQNV